MAWYHFSKTSAANASADPTQNWAEGMSPGAVNDSARALLAASAAYRDDVAGATVTTGTSAAYALATFSNFTSAAFMANQIVAFTPHVTNAAGPVTLTVDSQANIPLRSSPGKELLAGVLIAGTPYVAVYNNTDGALYLQNFYGSSPYLIPIGAGMDYWGATSPNPSFALAQGQAISRTTYATLFSLFGTTYGVGDGSTTFNIPDKVGRVSAMLDAGSARISATYFGGNPANLGAVGGGESKTLVTSNLPAYTPTGTIANGEITTSSNATRGSTGTNAAAPAGGPSFLVDAGSITFTSTQAASTFTGAAQGGASTPLRTVQPTIVCNYILRVT